MDYSNLRIELDVVKIALNNIKNAKSITEINEIIKKYEEFNINKFDMIGENANYTYPSLEERDEAFKVYKDKPKGLLHFQMMGGK